MLVQPTLVKQSPLPKAIFLLAGKESTCTWMWNWQNSALVLILLPLALQVRKCTALEIKPVNDHQVDTLASALCANISNYTLLLWKPRTFGSSSAQPLSHHPFWSARYSERKAQLSISHLILCVTTTWQTPCFWRVPETRFLKIIQMGVGHVAALEQTWGFHQWLQWTFCKSFGFF